MNVQRETHITLHKREVVAALKALHPDNFVLKAMADDGSNICVEVVGNAVKVTVVTAV